MELGAYWRARRDSVLEKAASLEQAVIKVGDGRGFVVERRRQRFVLTAAHCLPFLPPAHPMSYTEERTYAALLGPMSGSPIMMVDRAIGLMSTNS